MKVANQYMSKVTLLLVLCLVAGRVSYAQDPLVRNLWYNEEKTGKIQIWQDKDGKFYGKVVWLKEPNRNGKPKTDINNPDKAHQNDPELGLMVLKGFTKDGAQGYEDGYIYDPTKGKTYSCKMTLEGNELHVRGYIGISLIGRTTTWTKAEQ
jgi:uncharacterized protein (DUF2147 family)